MNHPLNELTEEFPSRRDLIARLRAEDPVFDRLTLEYARLNERVHAADSYEKPLEDLAEHRLKKRRMFLKDEIVRRMNRAS